MHKPVLLKEVIEILNPQSGDFIIDGTFGGGGHTMAILKKVGPMGKVLGVDWNENAISKGESRIKNQELRSLILIKENFANLPEILQRKEIASVASLPSSFTKASANRRNDVGEIRANGLLLDLGISSDELENSGRGFSFQKDESLLMTYNDSQTPVKELLRQLNKEELAEIIKNYGEENWAAKIAQTIKETLRKKPIETSKELAELIKNTLPKNYEHGRIHPATRTFMALRIYANKELENLESILKNINQILLPKGRVAIISFHSLEDRLVKNYFRDLAKQGLLEIITKKPITASQEEIMINPRARSAKLRAAFIN